MNKFLIFFSTILIICACDISIQDDIINLGNGYYYLIEGGNANGIYFSSTEKRKIEREILWSGVLDVKYDDNFIIAKRKIFKEIIIDSLYRKIDNSYSFVDILMNNPKNLEKSVFKNRKYEAKDSIYYFQLIKNGFTKNNTINDQKILRAIADSIYLQNSNLKERVSKVDWYYIIDKRNHKIRTFSNSNDFQTKKTELGFLGSVF